MPRRGLAGLAAWPPVLDEVPRGCLPSGEGCATKGMNSNYSPAVNLIAGVLYSTALLAYGWFAGGLAGLLAMGFLVCFFSFGLRGVIADSTVGSAWATLKWFLYFLGFHFIIYVLDEPLSWKMLHFLGVTLTALAGLFRGVSVEEQTGFAVGLLVIFGVGYLILWLRG